MGARALWWLLILGMPAPALARVGGRLLVVLYALPMLIPVLGITGASFGLRVSRSPLLWRFLCGLLGLNSALLGGLLAEQPNEVTGVIFLLAHLGMAGAMLFTVPDNEEDKTRVVLGRLGNVLLLGLLPGLLVGAFVR